LKAEFNQSLSAQRDEGNVKEIFPHKLSLSHSKCERPEDKKEEKEEE
jgi:hypothetical protein